MHGHNRPYLLLPYVDSPPVAHFQRPNWQSQVAAAAVCYTKRARFVRGDGNEWDSTQVHLPLLLPFLSYHSHTGSLSFPAFVPVCLSISLICSIHLVSLSFFCLLNAFSLCVSLFIFVSLLFSFLYLSISPSPSSLIYSLSISIFVSFCQRKKTLHLKSQCEHDLIETNRFHLLYLRS